MSATYAQIKAQFDSIPTDAELIEQDFDELITKHEQAGVPREFILAQLADMVDSAIQQDQADYAYEVACRHNPQLTEGL